MSVREKHQRAKQSVPAEVLASYDKCEERLSSHHSHLLETGRRLADRDRRLAFMASYYSLRVQAPACLPRPLGRARGQEASVSALRDWRDSARLCHQGEPHQAEEPALALSDTMRRFQLPMSPWVDLETGLRKLVQNDPVKDMQDMVERARLLAVAPSSVFFRILCAHRGVRRFHLATDVDVEDLTHDPGAFAYMVGLMCDVFKEPDYRQPVASSIPQELLDRHRLKVSTLPKMKEYSVAPIAFENLMEDLSLFAWSFYESGVAKITQVAAHLPREAIEHLDGFLDHYKAVLKNLERVRFSPRSFAGIAKGLEPRFSPVSFPRSS